MSIGAVLEQLRPDFPEVTISKIRFLESEGLVRPARTESGYRQFAPIDIERLRFVLSAQRDHYLPLKVIKDQLDSGERRFGSDLSATRVVGVRRSPLDAGRSVADSRADRAAGPQSAWLDREDFLGRTGLGAADLRELEQYGLLRPNAAGLYDVDLVAVAKTAAAMMAFGIEPRHLRAFRTAADREVGLLAQLVTPVARQRDSAARARAEAMSRELSTLSVALHTLLVEVGLRDTIKG